VPATRDYSFPCLCRRDSRPVMVPTQSCIKWVPRAISPGVKTPRDGADHSRPSNAKFENGGGTPLLPFTSER
jgi:hypothetical protein